MKNKDVYRFYFREKIQKVFLLGFLILLSCTGNPAKPTAQVPVSLQLRIQSIAFNWDTSQHEFDALNLRKNLTETISLPEYSPQNNAAALYVAGQNNVKIKVSFALENPVEISLRIKGFVDKQNLVFSETNEMPVKFVNGLSEPIEFVLLDPVPANLQMSAEFFRWKIRDENYAGQVLSGPHRIFVVFKDPAEIGGDSAANCWHSDFNSCQTPWVDALQLAMRSEQGNVAGLTTPEDALKNLTTYFFYRHGAEYDVYAESLNHYCKVWQKSFNLTKYLFEMNPQNRVTCYDQGGALRIMAALLGIDLEVVYIARVGYIQTAPLVGIGPCNNPFFRYRGRPDAELIAAPVVGEDLIKPYRTRFGNHILNRYQGKIYDANSGPQLGTLGLADYLAGFIDISTPPEAQVSDYPENLKIETWTDRFTILAEPPGNTNQIEPNSQQKYFRQCAARHALVLE